MLLFKYITTRHCVKLHIIQGGVWKMNSEFFSNDDLADLFAEMDSLDTDNDVADDTEMLASQRRFNEIIQKHKNDI